MEIGLNKNDIIKISRVFENFKELDEVMVFGSRAKGNYKAGSDIDLALKGKNLNLNVLNQISTELDELYLPYIFDLCIYNQVKNQDLIDHIKRVGISFYTNLPTVKL